GKVSDSEEKDPNGQTDDRSGTPSPWMTILWKIKTACFATFAYGYFQASVVLFLPLYLMHERGIEESKTIYVTAFFAAGMLLFTNVAGRLGDKLGHLAVMRVLATIGLVQILGFVFLPSYAWMLGAVFVAGATLASLSPLSIALQGHAIEPKDYSRGNSMYNALYAAGMLLGPAISSLIFDAYKGAPMLYHLAAIWAGFVIFSIVFAKDDKHIPSKGQAVPKEVTTSSASSPA
ncbi:MAG TPA: MFS transporter, partial [Polyangiaceae bacterium]